MVFAAIQVHQTHSALVTGSDSDCDASSPNLIVRTFQSLVTAYVIIMLCLQTCDVPGSLWRKIEPFLIVAPCVIAGSWLFMLFWIRQLYAEFGSVAARLDLAMSHLMLIVGLYSTLSEPIPK